MLVSSLSFSVMQIFVKLSSEEVGTFEQTFFRNLVSLIIAAVMFVSGLGFSSVGGVTFTVGGAAVTLSGLAIAALCGVILNAILPGNDYEFGISVEGDKSADLGSY